MLALLAAVAVPLIALLWLGPAIEHHLGEIESWVADLGPWGVVSFIGLFVLATSLLVPEAILGVAAGALFGPAWGLAATSAGSLLAAALQYALSRRLLRALIQRTLAKRPSLAAIGGAVLRDEVRLQVLLRLAPLNAASISYLLGAVGVRFPGFLLSTLALTPHLLLEVYVGHAGKHMVRLAGGGRGAGLYDLAILGGLVAGLAVLVILSRAAHRALLHAVAYRR